MSAIEEHKKKFKNGERYTKGPLFSLKGNKRKPLNIKKKSTLL